MSSTSCRPSCQPMHLLHAAALPAQAHSSQRHEPRSLRSAGEGAVCAAKASLTHSYIPAPDLQLKRIAGDGRCLFRATACAAHHLETGTFASPAQELQAADDLRANVCLELQRHKADVEPFLEQPFDSYVQGMKRPSTWGGEPELSVLQHCIKRPVKVWMLAATGLQVFSQYGEDLYSSESVNILFNGVNACTPNAHGAHESTVGCACKTGAVRSDAKSWGQRCIATGTNTGTMGQVCCKGIADGANSSAIGKHPKTGTEQMGSMPASFQAPRSMPSCSPAQPVPSWPPAPQLATSVPSGTPVCPLILVQPRMPATVEGSLPTSVEPQAAACQHERPVESPMQRGSGGAATQDALQQQPQQDQQAARQSAGPEASAAPASTAPTPSSANGARTPQAAAGAPQHPVLTQLLPAGSAEQPQGPGAAEPAPQAQQRTFRRATKQITTEQQLQAFLASLAVRSFVGFILSLNEAVHGQRLSHPCPVSEVAQGLVAHLQRLNQWVDGIPPVKQALRYGNPAFRDWHARMVEAAEPMVHALLPLQLQAAAPELASYWEAAFGHPGRLDYGTGHETTFVAFLYGLARLGLIGDGEREAFVTRVFAAYLTLIRKVQITYWLEPAGSHGCWGLDDYQFLPYLWGSGQLLGNPLIQPSSIHNDQIVNTYADEYLYLGCIRFIRQVKKGALAETSPMINDISGVPKWEKVNSGMMKMYQVEVLSKLPIMQHFLFGSLLPLDFAESSAGQH